MPVAAPKQRPFGDGEIGSKADMMSRRSTRLLLPQEWTSMVLWICLAPTAAGNRNSDTVPFGPVASAQVGPYRRPPPIGKAAFEGD